MKRAAALAAALCAIPVVLALVGWFGPFATHPTLLDPWSGAAYDLRAPLLPGQPTIDPPITATSYALGARAATDLLSGTLPLWNYYEGLGAPLLGAMHSAALFPPTLLLALPNGQILEHVLLQLLAGLGAYLFFRRFGLSMTAAVCGAVLYELNGVFAWLRSATYNPVAFLPWLMFTIESVRAGAFGLQPSAGRMPFVALGAVIAALAVYAGFPEQVYFYAMLLLVWAVFRLKGLNAGQCRTYVGDLVLVALLGLALSAPVLLAFATYLPDANTGLQEGTGVTGGMLHPTAYLQYLMPYAFGPILATQDLPTWAGIGGYVGFLPVVLALAALVLRDRRDAKLVLLAWILICLGATQGWPGLYQAFMSLPLAKVDAAYRYLNPSWIFAVVFLAAMFIDRIPTLPVLKLKSILVCAVAGGCVIVLLAVAANVPALMEFWLRSSANRAAVTLSFAAAAVLAVTMMIGTRRANAAGAVGAVLVAEAFLLFTFPYLSFPRTGRFDDGAIAFLNQNVGFNRVVGTDGFGIGPNLGSAWGIPNLNVRTLPAPQQTIDYLSTHLDPAADGLAFTPAAPGQTARLALFRERLPAYAHAGVKYVLAAADFNAVPAYAVDASREEEIRPFAAGDSLDVAIPAAGAPPSIAAVTVLVYGRARNATGTVTATVCSDSDCALAAADIRKAQDGKALLLVLDRTVTARAKAGYTVRIQRHGGDRLFSLVMATLKDRDVPVLKIYARPDQVPVYAGPTLAVHELKNARPYFSAPDCALTVLSRNSVQASCQLPSTLTRLELYLRGWSARVNGAPARINTEDNTFQTVDLPLGESRIDFAYAPPGFGIAMATALAAMLIVIRMLLVAVLTRRRISDRLGKRAAYPVSVLPASALAVG